MSNTNDVTGDKIITKTGTDNYRDGWDRIFGKNKEQQKEKEEEQNKEKIEQDKK